MPHDSWCGRPIVIEADALIWYTVLRFSEVALAHAFVLGGGTGILKAFARKLSDIVIEHCPEIPDLIKDGWRKSFAEEGEPDA